MIVLNDFTVQAAENYINSTYDKGVSDIVVNELNLKKDIFIPVDSTQKVSDILKLEIKNNLVTQESKQYLDLIGTTINEIKNSSKNNLSVVIADLELIKSNIDKELKGDEKIILMSTVVTAISSLNYWEVNSDKWNNLVSSYGSANKVGCCDWNWFQNTVSDMVTADAYGAGMGALVGLIAIVAGPGGLVVIAASAVAYGANASAGAGFIALLSSIK